MFHFVCGFSCEMRGGNFLFSFYVQLRTFCRKKKKKRKNKILTRWARKRKKIKIQLHAGRIHEGGVSDSLQGVEMSWWNSFWTIGSFSNRLNSLNCFWKLEKFKNFFLFLAFSIWRKKWKWTFELFYFGITFHYRNSRTGISIFTSLFFLTFL